MSMPIRTSIALIARDKFSWAPLALKGLIHDAAPDDEILVMDSGYPEAIRKELTSLASGAPCKVELVAISRFANMKLPRFDGVLSFGTERPGEESKCQGHTHQSSANEQSTLLAKVTDQLIK